LTWQVNANTALSLQDAAAEADQITLTSPGLGEVQLTDALAAIRETSGLPNSYATYLSAENLTLPAAISQQLPDSDLPQAIEVVKADATVTLDRPLNRHTLPNWQTDPGRLRGLTLRDLTIRWGDLALTGDGEITVDDSGTPEGTLTIRVINWEKMLETALAAGIVPKDLRFMARRVGESLSGGSQNFDLPIRFQNGNWAAGPFPLGMAPRF